MMDRCEACSFLFTNPAPDDNDIERYYSASTYAPYNATAPDFVEQLASLIRPILIRGRCNFMEAQNHSSHKRLLDIGCGIGALAAAMQKRGWQVTAVEPSADARRRGKELFSLDIGDMESLTALPSESFDVIVLWQVLEHIRDFHAVMDTVHRLLSPAGVVVISVPNITCFDATYYKEWWAGYDVPRHYSHFAVDTFHRLASMHAFNVVRSARQTFMAYYLAFRTEHDRHGSLLRAFLVGCVSELRSLFSLKQSSCLVYVLRKDMPK